MVQTTVTAHEPAADEAQYLPRQAKAAPTRLLLHQALAGIVVKVNHPIHYICDEYVQDRFENGGGPADSAFVLSCERAERSAP
jgi:hypothetical protein